MSAQVFGGKQALFLKQLLGPAPKRQIGKKPFPAAGELSRGGGQAAVLTGRVHKG